MNKISINNNYSTFINNKKDIDINKDIFNISRNNIKSRNKSNFKKEFNTNNNFNNITFYKEKKNNYINNSTFYDKKNSSKKKLNLSYINKRKESDLSNKKRIIKIKNNNDKLSLKEKIHLFHQRKDALIKEYFNKNKILKEQKGNDKI